MTTKHRLTRWAGLLAASAIVVAACSTDGGASVAPSADGGGDTAYEQFAPDAALLEAAKAEGTLTTIALPHDWCNYGESISTFKERTGL